MTTAPIALREQTAGRLLRRLGEIPGGGTARGAGRGGARVVLVRCTSAEPAAGSGVGAECYPGVVVRQAASVAVADQEDAGALWLTVLAGTEAARPAADGLYWCQLAGPLEVGGVTRPRAFGTVPGAVHGSTGAGSTNLTNGPWVVVDDITLPGAGTYLVWAGITAGCGVAVEPNVSTESAIVRARLTNVATGVAVPDTTRVVCKIFESLTLFTYAGGGVLVHETTGSAFAQAVVVVTAETEIGLEAQGEFDAGGSAGVGSTQMGFVLIAGAGPSGGGGFTGTVGE